MKSPADPVVAAWYQYLGETLGVTGERYEELEPWAWVRLQRVLTELKRKVYA